MYLHINAYMSIYVYMHLCVYIYIYIYNPELYKKREVSYNDSKRVVYRSLEAKSALLFYQQ